MKCKENECLHCSHCDILGECMMQHSLILPYAEQFKKMVLSVSGKKRSKKIVRIFQALKPEKVNIYQLNRYFGLKMFNGIDLDKPGADKKLLKQQKNFKNDIAREDRNKILKELMELPDDISNKQMNRMVKKLSKEPKINPVWD